MRVLAFLIVALVPCISVAADLEDSLQALVKESGPQLETLENENWDRRIDAEAVLAYRVNVDKGAEILRMPPVPTRAGHPRFVGPLMGEDATPALLLYRLQRGSEATEVRSALVEALGSQIQTRPGLGLALMETEEAEEVRQRIVMMVRRAPYDVAAPVLHRAFTDESALAQEAAAVTAGNRKDGWRWKQALVAQLQNEEGRVRAASARALGWLEQKAIFNELAALLTDIDAEVRLQAVTAIHRLDPDRARLHPDLIALQNDSDPVVASLATRLVQR
jgi:hypothetical protein